MDKALENILTARGKDSSYYHSLYGYVPWTVTIADALEKGIDWDKNHIIMQLRLAQDKIDDLTMQLKEKNT